jgi:hypothetical protein
LPARNKLCLVLRRIQFHFEKRAPLNLATKGGRIRDSHNRRSDKS